MKREDDFEVDLNGGEEEDTAELPEVPQRPVFDWQREDPHDFRDEEQREEEATREVPATPAKEAPYAARETVRATPPPSVQTEKTAPVPAPQPEPVTLAAQPARQANGMTVLISGGDRGIGAAAARLFWRAGYRTAIFYHKNEDAARALINELGSDCVAVRCDVASRAACEAAYKVVERTFGAPDVLVCNAGIAQQKLFTDITEEEWQRMIGVDLSGAFHLCQLVLPAMVRRKYGRILTVSSMWGQTGGSCEVHYSAAKAGLIGLTKALAKEEGPSGITVNCVAPGVVDTDMMASFTAADKQALAEETPVARLGTAEEVANALLFLAGREAGYITGQVLGVNGGLVI